MFSRATFVTAFLIAVIVSSAAIADGDALIGNVAVFRVVTQDNGTEAFLPADEARPKDVIEYRLTYANQGEAAVRNITITDPIPNGTEYLDRTATSPSKGVVEFSIDNGRTYHTWPVQVKKTDKDGKEIWVDATADMVTHIRWMMADDFAPDTEITFTYRTVIK